MKYIYVISDGDRCQKVGVAADPMVRLRDLQTASSFKLELVEAFRIETAARAYEIEKCVHRRLVKFAMTGEWFDLPASAAVAAVRTAILDPTTMTAAKIRKS